MISVIIPMYNSEKYIERCLRSVCEQTYQNIEIIVIDDGSSDNGEKICKRIANSDSRIYVYHFENHGVSWARNKGIELAKGEYITFIDSDDYIDKEMIKNMVDHIHEADLVICGIKRVNSLTGAVIGGWLYGEGIYSIKKYLGLLEKSNMNPFFGGPYCKLINKKLLIDNNIKFMLGQSLAEDFCFNLDLLNHINKIYIIEKEYYCYMSNTIGSLSQYNYQKLDDELFFQQEKRTYEKYCNLMKQHEYKSEPDILLQMWKMYISKISLNHKLNVAEKSTKIMNKLKEYPQIKKEISNSKMKNRLLINKYCSFVICLCLTVKYSRREIR